MIIKLSMQSKYIQVKFLCQEAYFLFSLVLGFKYLLLKVHVVARVSYRCSSWIPLHWVKCKIRETAGVRDKYLSPFYIYSETCIKRTPSGNAVVSA